MAKDNLLLKEIDAAVASAALMQRPRTWFDNLHSDAQRVLIEARRKFHAGGYDVKRRTLARLLCGYCQKNGWKSCDERRMSEWLAQN